MNTTSNARDYRQRLHAQELVMPRYSDIRHFLEVHPFDNNKEDVFVHSVSLAGSLTVGRCQGCDIVIQQPTVSGHHCTFAWGAHGLFVTDAGSKNGTQINGNTVGGRALVSPNSIIGLGLVFLVMADKHQRPFLSVSSLQGFERQTVRFAWGNMMRAARALGVHRSTLYRKVSQWNR